MTITDKTPITEDPIAQLMHLTHALRFVTNALANEDGENCTLPPEGAACITNIIAEKLDQATENLMHLEDNTRPTSPA